MKVDKIKGGGRKMEIVIYDHYHHRLSVFKEYTVKTSFLEKSVN